MRICIFSDIHGNAEAFEQMLAAEEALSDCFIFAGDIFGYFYGQRHLIDRMMAMRNLYAVLGNHDYNYLHLHEFDIKEMTDKYGSSYKTVLTPRQHGYLEELPHSLKLQLDGKNIGVFHGGFDDFLCQRIYPDTPLHPDSAWGRYDYIITGHTHHRFVRQAGKVTVINPGSLGQPRDGKGFGYCTLDTSDGACRFITVDADARALVSETAKNDPGTRLCAYIKQKYGEQKE